MTEDITLEKLLAARKFLDEQQLPEVDRHVSYFGKTHKLLLNGEIMEVK